MRLLVVSLALVGLATAAGYDTQESRVGLKRELPQAPDAIAPPHAIELAPMPHTPAMK